MIEAVVFDLDGTLIELPIDYEKFLRKVRKITKIDDVNPITKTVAKLDEATKKKVFRVWDKTEALAWKKGSVKNEGMTLYKKFSEEPKALVTMQGRTFTQKTVQSLGLAFDFVVTREDSLERVVQLRLAAEKLSVPIENVLFVGNTDGDEAAAKTVECQFQRVPE